MAFWAIVPVKPLKWGKSRLAGVLTQEEREVLNYQLFINTLSTLKAVSAIEQILVISRDQAVLSQARALEARTVQENGTPDLNIALLRATIIVKEYATQGVIILPADLPLLTSEDVLSMLELAQSPPVVVIAPDRHYKGTNALLVSPVGLIDYSFGQNSFQKHCEMARIAGAKLKILELPSFALDMDLPEDLDLVSKVLGKWIPERFPPIISD